MSIALVLGSGGHTSELLKIVSNLSKTPASTPSSHLLIYSSGDSLSLSKYNSTFGNLAAEVAGIRRIPRARNVGQSYFTSIFTTIYSLLACILLLVQSYPKIIICNGPGISVTVSLASYILNIISFGFIKRSKIIYIESVARSKSLSLTGKILLYLADSFMVQWPQLAKKYQGRSNVIYSGILV